MEEIDKKIIASFVIVLFLSIIYIITQPIDVEFTLEIDNSILADSITELTDLPINKTEMTAYSYDSYGSRKSYFTVTYHGPIYIFRSNWFLK